MSTENLRHWSELSKTDEKFTKPFKRSGGFSGTDINPTWRQMRMTEQFGPVGIGWGMTKPDYSTHQAGDEIAVYCTVGIWFTDNGQRSETVWGVGGDIVAKRNKEGRLVLDDEAFKKAYTDALGNAMKAIGVSADVYLRQFEDSKYRQEVAQEFEERRQAAKEPTEGEKAAAATIRMGLELAETPDDLAAFWREHKTHIDGLPKPLFEELRRFAGDRKRLLTAPAHAAE